MATKLQRYTLDTINDIIFQGFDYSLPEDTMKTISEIALKVGAPDYVRTPVFQKRENPMRSSNTNTNIDSDKKLGASSQVRSTVKLSKVFLPFFF